MKLPRIYADFNNSDPHGRLRLSCLGTFQSLSRQRLNLQDGMCATFHDEELEVDGTVRYSDEERRWVAEIVWEEIHEQDAPVPAAVPAAAQVSP